MIALVRSMKARMRGFLLLENEQRRSASLSHAQREASRPLYEVALRRLRAAQALRLQNELGPALVLYREGNLYLARAYLSARGVEGAANDSAAVFDELRGALEASSETAPPRLAETASFVASSDPFSFDRLAADEARRAAEDLELTAAWLANLLKPVSPRQIKLRRALRWTVVALAIVALFGGGAIWVFTPKNVALHARVTSSSQAFDTVPAGVVDGHRFGQLGFHSQNEDSPWLAIDLGRRFAIRRIKVFGRSDCCFDQSIPLAIEASNDGVTYTKVDERTEGFSAYDPWVIKPASLVAQFIRLRRLKSGLLVVSEVEVNGRPAK